MSSAHSRACGFLLCALASVFAPAATTSYEYDALGRLRVVTHDNRIVTTYTLDPAGNRTVVTDVPLGPTSAPPSIFVPSSSSTGDYSVSWGEAAGTVLTYELYESTSASFSSQTLRYSGQQRTATISNLPNGTYYYRVRACGYSGCSGYREGATSVVVNTPLPSPSPPTNLSKTHIANCAWRANWSAVDGAATYILRDTAGAEQTVATLSAHVACPINNPNANQPRWVKACSPAGLCSAAAYFP